MKKENNFIEVSVEKEWIATINLSNKIRLDKWMNPSTIVVNCFPEYSSRLTQTLNHLLSPLNKNSLFEQIDLAIPAPSYTQVWNPLSKAYEGFDTYLKNWINDNVFSCNFLFVTNAVAPKHLNKIKLSMRNKLDNEHFRFCALYVPDDSTFLPDYYEDTYNSNKTLVFEWENILNPLSIIT